MSTHIYRRVIVENEFDACCGSVTNRLRASGRRAAGAGAICRDAAPGASVMTLPPGSGACGSPQGPNIARFARKVVAGGP